MPTTAIYLLRNLPTNPCLTLLVFLALLSFSRCLLSFFLSCMFRVWNSCDVRAQALSTEACSVLTGTEAVEKKAMYCLPMWCRPLECKQYAGSLPLSENHYCRLGLNEELHCSARAFKDLSAVLQICSSLPNGLRFCRVLQCVWGHCGLN